MVESGNGKIGLQAGGIHFLERIDGALICLGLGFGCQIARGQRADGAGGLFFDGVAQQTKERQCRNRNDNDDNDVLDHCLAGAFDVGFFHSMLR